MSTKKQIIKKAWERAAEILSADLKRPVSIEEARKIVAERNHQKEEAKNIKDQIISIQKQKHLQRKQERLQRKQERLQQEQELKKEQNDIQHKFDINVSEETARIHEYLLQRNLKKEQEKNVWKFRKPDESQKEWIARIKKHNNEQRAIYLQHHGKHEKHGKH